MLQARPGLPGDVTQRPEDEDGDVLRTVIALFDDILDAEQVLSVLRKSDQPSEHISVILRERVMSPDTRLPRQTVLSRVIASSALEAVGGWLQGLASLILPDRASYLVAGPIGAVLATIRDARPVSPRAVSDAARTANSSHQLARAFTSFGFSRDEAMYLEHRVVAGSPLIAITSSEADNLRNAHQAFSKHTAVHVGLARTERSINRTAARLLVTGPHGGGTVVIADAIAPLKRATEGEITEQKYTDMIGRDVVTVTGETIGSVTDVLYETRLGDDSDSSASVELQQAEIVPRYFVVQFGGVLRVGRQRVALPTPVVVKTNWELVIVSATREEVQSAPRYDDLSPLSRQDEVAICTHYGVPLYWQRELGEAPV
ncbi:MAG: hypothetical protein AVDCRST_MAG43-1109 [uncultured Thermomicrobiales bacterium]|uniref:PRC-barrel domain-containing protein n=1 Tax=uncultured Thermomicrobiales bacterium TaxID=1645740 RepID=A0A6J4ULZ8_9BACT|nr:MAG: hypothetical protein AVDCRST_MAG43-1109 [uncultured Thermomicrobiales bacterium]